MCEGIFYYMTENSENRFSDRVENYIKYRPHYPQAMIDLLCENNFLKNNDIVADVGMGTGISANLFLQNGFSVFGVEPNDAMRNAAEEWLKSFIEKKQLTTFRGNAENTTIPAHSINLVIAAQAFHWFEKDKFKDECLRILKPEGYVALIWNDRRTDSTDFLKLYEEFLKMFATDYAQVNHKNMQDKKVFETFFGNNHYKEFSIPNHQAVDLTSLRGRVLSSSYMPNTGHPEYEYMMYVLRKIFQRYQENNKVILEHDTRIYIGQIK